QDDTGSRGRSQLTKRLLPIRGPGDAVALGLQDRGQRITYVLIILHDQDAIARLRYRPLRSVATSRRPSQHEFCRCAEKEDNHDRPTAGEPNGTHSTTPPKEGEGCRSEGGRSRRGGTVPPASNDRASAMGREPAAPMRSA